MKTKNPAFLIALAFFGWLAMFWLLKAVDHYCIPMLAGQWWEIPYWFTWVAVLFVIPVVVILQFAFGPDSDAEVSK